jgi:hypothetical protein
MVQFEDFLEITERNDAIVQRSLSEINTEVLSTALVGIAEDIKNIFLRNMSRRASALLTADIMEKQGTHPSRIGSSQEFLIQLLQKHSKYVGDEEPSPDKNSIPEVQLDSDESIIATFRALASYVRKHGFLPLEAIEKTISHPIMREGIELMVDGADPLYVQSILEKCKIAYLRNVEARIDMILDGLDSIAAKEFPYMVEHKLRAHLTQA